MAYYFVGGEDHDFARVGNTGVETATSAFRRSAYARCALRATGSASATDCFLAQFGTTLTSFWHTARWYLGTSLYTNTYNPICYYDGTQPRLMICTSSTGQVRITKQDNAGTRTGLATSTNTLASGQLYKIDVQVSSYGASGTVNVYIDNVLWITYTGDLTTNSATSLSAFSHGSYASSVASYWSEIILGTDDTRNMGLVTLPPAANGNAFAWSNSYANVDETSIDDTDTCTSSSANDIMQTTVTSSGVTGNPAVKAVCVSARASKGGTGPQNIQASVRTNSNNYFSSSIALPASYGRVANIWETNPNTSVAWTAGDLTAAGFNIGLKSIT